MELLQLRDDIDKLPKTNQIEILRILQKNHETFTENNNGVFINLIYTSKETIKEIHQYLEYISLQSWNLKEIENKKSELFSEYFSNANHSNANHNENGDIQHSVMNA